MHSIYFHFYKHKNYLYSKPIKGLQGCGLDYRFHFNGQEKDDEVSGAGNTMSAQFWEYDARLGRRWNIDQVVKHWESGYASFANNPIIYKDPNGLDIINGNAQKRDAAKVEIESLESTIKQSDPIKDKACIGELNDKLNLAKKEYAHQSEMAERVDKLLANYKDKMKDDYEKMDNLLNGGDEEVDLIIDMDFGYAFSEGYWGATIQGFEKKSEEGRTNQFNIQMNQNTQELFLRPISDYGINKIRINLDARVGIDPKVGGLTLAHEFGHAEFQAMFTKLYAEYVIENQAEVKSTGGHGYGDPSGDAAIKKRDKYANKVGLK